MARIAPERIERLRAALPELPDAKKRRFVAEFGLAADDASTLVAEKEAADYFETVAAGRDPKLAAAWVTTNLFGMLNKRGADITQSPISAERLGRLLDRIADGTLSGRLAKDVFEIMAETGGDPDAIVAEKGLRQITDEGAIEAACAKVVDDNPDQAAKVRGGEAKVLGWFVGQVMKATGGKANPQQVNAILRRMLGQ